MNLKGFPEFDNSFFSKIVQEVKFPETSKKTVKKSCVYKNAKKGLEFVA